MRHRPSIILGATSVRSSRALQLTAGAWLLAAAGCGTGTIGPNQPLREHGADAAADSDWFGDGQVPPASDDALPGDEPDNQPPVAMVSAAPSEAAPGAVRLDASASIDPNPADTLMARWDWQADGVWDTDWSAELAVVHRYPCQRSFFTRVAVRDPHGAESVTELPVEVSLTGALGVLAIVDWPVLQPIEALWSDYVSLVEAETGVSLFADCSRDWSTATPVEIRARLRNAFQTNFIEGAILMGSIPYARYQYSGGDVCIAPLYYEDFDMVWNDPDQDGLFEDKILDANNPTEIWTAWWLPPINSASPAAQSDALAGFLTKANLFHRGGPVGSGAFLPVINEFSSYGQAWSDALRDAAGFPAAAISMRVGELGVFSTGWSQQVWQQAHLLTHGMPNGAYFADGAFDVNAYLATPQSNRGANLVTMSGCHGANIHGSINTPAPNPAGALALQMVFRSDSPTLAVYGSTSSQSTGLFAAFHQPLLSGTRNEFIGRGFFALRNSDVVWGTSHYMFRTQDDKCLVGDPFFKLR